MRQALAVFREEEINYGIVLLYQSMGERTDFAGRSCQPGMSCSGSTYGSC